MKKLEFKTFIEASPKEVWNNMLGAETFKQWTNVSWPGAYYEGEWKRGEEIRFLGGPDGGGTLAVIEEIRQHEYVLAKHIGVITSDGSIDTTSEQAKTWVGNTESYTFNKKDDGTEVVVEINTTPEWEKMFNDGWPDALEELKRICEKETAVH